MLITPASTQSAPQRDNDDEAAEMARAFFRVDEQLPLPYRFAAQPITEVSGPGGAVYRIALRRLRAPS